jgi:PKD domain
MASGILLDSVYPEPSALDLDGGWGLLRRPSMGLEVLFAVTFLLGDPEACFKAASADQSLAAPLRVTLDPRCSGDLRESNVRSLLWDFGDGKTAQWFPLGPCAARIPPPSAEECAASSPITHDYEMTGEYVIALTLTPAHGEPTSISLSLKLGEGLAIDHFRRGDANYDGIVDLSDAVVILAALFLGLPGDQACLKTWDVVEDGGITVTDPIALINWLFLGGTEPDAPGPYNCGGQSRNQTFDCRYRSC